MAAVSCVRCEALRLTGRDPLSFALDDAVQKGARWRDLALSLLELSPDDRPKGTAAVGLVAGMGDEELSLLARIEEQQDRIAELEEIVRRQNVKLAEKRRAG